MSSDFHDISARYALVKDNLRHLSSGQINFLSVWCVSRLFTLPNVLGRIQTLLGIGDSKEQILLNIHQGQLSEYRGKLQGLLDHLDEYAADFDELDVRDVYALATLNSALNSRFDAESLPSAIDALACLSEQYQSPFGEPSDDLLVTKV